MVQYTTAEGDEDEYDEDGEEGRWRRRMEACDGEDVYVDRMKMEKKADGEEGWRRR